MAALLFIVTPAVCLTVGVALLAVGARNDVRLRREAYERAHLFDSLGGLSMLHVEATG